MQQTTRAALDNYDALVRRYEGRLEEDLELCWDSDTLVSGDGGTDIAWLCDPSGGVSSVPEEARIALINYDRLIRLRGYVALPNGRVIYTHGPSDMRMDWTTDAVVITVLAADGEKTEIVSFDELCMRWPGVPYGD